MQSKTIEEVRNYYGKVLSTKSDLKTTACCTSDDVPQDLKTILKEIHPEVMEKFYGCGSPIPAQLEGCEVLDLGSGTGRDCFVLAKLVGENGRVIGVDMTTEQIETARKHTDYHMQKFGFSRPNVEFRQGYIEDLESAGIANNSIDVVISNCVFNLSPDKERLFSEIFRVLKPGGELYFSDVFADRRIPPSLAQDPILLGECLGGAMYTEDFRRMLMNLGCADYRLVSSRRLALTHSDVLRKIGMVNFYSMTIRAFKLDLEDRCEDYGQVAYYKGTIPESPHIFELDDHHLLKTGQPLPVCSNTAKMLNSTRYQKHFEVVGSMDTHFGLFDCTDSAPPINGHPQDSGTGCC